MKRIYFFKVALACAVTVTFIIGALSCVSSSNSGQAEPAQVSPDQVFHFYEKSDAGVNAHQQTDIASTVRISKNSN